VEGEMDRPEQLKLPGVPQAKQGREVAPEWAWTEASVWTERMLATLERGFKGGKWYSLMDKVWSQGNLKRAMEQVCRNQGSAGVDGQSTEAFQRKSEVLLPRLSELLRQGQYQPAPVKRCWIEKLGSKEKRPLGIPTVQGRVVETALRNVLEPIFEQTFAEHSYGFRPGRGAKDALRRVDHLLKSGQTWIVDADLKGYFDSIPQDKLMERLSEKISDGAVLDLIQKLLRQGVMESGKGWEPTEQGTPQGAVVSPLLANVYLNPLDHLMAGQGREMVRYADDFIVLCASEAEARQALLQIQQWVGSAGLVLHPLKTRLVDATQAGGFDFLGYHFERGMKWPRQKSLEKFKDTIREKTPRNSGQSLKEIIEGVNRTTRGWFEYFKHSQKSVFRELEGWTRRRLRAILNRRHRIRGWKNTRCPNLWPNTCFVEAGLFSMATARAQASQSHGRNH
jgi:RNA-directed DNA polymerase